MTRETPCHSSAEALGVREVVKDTDGESTKSGDVLGTLSDAKAAPVHVKILVDDIVATIFDGPPMHILTHNFRPRPLAEA